MTSRRIFILMISVFALAMTGAHAQTPAQALNRANSTKKTEPRLPEGTLGNKLPLAGEARFLASDEGRAFLLATGHPLAKYAIERFGEPAKNTVVPQAWMKQFSNTSQPEAAPAVPCGGPSGARFNLEARANAVPQNQASADFLLNRIAAGNDLIVQGANDWRGNVNNGKWDHSVSGYYVHRSATADCSVQFEGGLPNIVAEAGTYVGIGNTVVAADPARDAFFLADGRIGPTGIQNGIGLFRASASTLLSTTACPNGTHTQAQATSCWAATPSMLVLPTAALGDIPQVVVDERSAGKGAGDVYVLAFGLDPNSSNLALLVACTNSLSSCSPLVSLNGSNLASGFNSMHVRTDGVITITYATLNSDGTDDIFFASCTPAGAPKAPVCGNSTLVQHIALPLNANFSLLTPLANFNALMFTYPKHAVRTESGGKFTDFVVYDDCKDPLHFGNPPVTNCLNGEVLLTTSTNNGQTWSTPVPVDTAAGHHFYPSITTDTSTGIAHIAYYSTEGDKFNHLVRVMRNQILPGSVAPGTPVAVTTVANPIDHTPQTLGSQLSDFYMGVVARGNGASGQSHLYTSFDSVVVNGTYETKPSPELNNHISESVY